MPGFGFGFGHHLLPRYRIVGVVGDGWVLATDAGEWIVTDAGAPIAVGAAPDVFVLVTDDGDYLVTDAGEWIITG